MRYSYIEIKLPRCRVFLTATEINRLLQRDPVLFQAALQRGKGVVRVRQAKEWQTKQDQ
jgi:hypothetical protein